MNIFKGTKYYYSNKIISDFFYFTLKYYNSNTLHLIFKFIIFKQIMKKNYDSNLTVKLKLSIRKSKINILIKYAKTRYYYCNISLSN